MQRILVAIVFLAFVFVACKKNESIIPPPPDTPGRQHEIPWPSLASSPWPMGSHDPQGTGRSASAAAPSGVVQKFVQGRRVTGSPVLGEDGTIYYQCEDSLLVYTLYALNPDGSLRWKVGLDSLRDTGYWKNYSRMIIGRDGTIYTNSLDRAIYGIAPEGHVKWMCRTPEGFLAQGMTIGLDGTLYVVSQNKTLYAIRQDGSVKWSRANGFNGVQNLVFSPDGNSLYVAGDPSGIYSLSLDGTTQWFYSKTTTFDNSIKMVDVDGDIYTEYGDSLVCITSQGTERWSVCIGHEPAGGVVAGSIDWNGNIACVGSLTDSTGTFWYLHSLDQQGRLRWRTKLSDQYPVTAVCDLENTTFVGSGSDGDYFAVKDDGTIKWHLRFSPRIDVSSSPAISASGMLILPSGSTTPTEVQGIFVIQ